VEEILSDKELRGRWAAPARSRLSPLRRPPCLPARPLTFLARCLNAKSLGETKNVNLPGVHVDIMVLTDKDVDDVRGAGGGQGAGRWGGAGRLPEA
jgi:hypothetical protein